MAKQSLETRINELLEEWSSEDLCEFFNHIEFMLDLCTVGNDGRSIIEEFEQKDEQEKNTLRMIRLAYTLSKMSESFAGKFVTCKIKFKGLWQEMEAVRDLENLVSMKKNDLIESIEIRMEA